MPPQRLEIHGIEIEQRRCEGVADVVDDDFQIVVPSRLIKKSNDLFFVRRVAGYGFGLAAGLTDRSGDGFQTRRGAPRDEDSNPYRAKR